MDFNLPRTLGEDSRAEEIYNRWLKTGNIYVPARDTVDVPTLASGTYTVFQDQNTGQLKAEAFNLSTDELYYLPNNKINTVVEEITSFWGKAEKFKQYKVKHKRGILFMGPQGMGKTSLVNLLVASILERDGLVFYVNSVAELFLYIEFANKCLRGIEPNRPVITVFEDIDKYMDGSGVESTLLNFLDGSDSLDHHVTLATTNRLDHLNDLLLRPSRFDWLVEVDKPSVEVRKVFFVRKGLEPSVAAKWAKDTDGYSIAEMKELFSSVVLLEIDYEQVKDKLKKQKDEVGTQTFKKKAKKGIGFLDRD